jgi:hypothetical protein
MYAAGGPIKALLVDEQRRCLWFLGSAGLGKLDRATESVTYVMSAQALVEIAPHKMAGDGRHLWLAGHEATRLRGGEGGGLACYDIPTSSFLVYRVSNTRYGGAPGLPGNRLTGVTAHQGMVWVNWEPYYYGCWGVARLLPNAAQPADRWKTFSVESTESRRGARDGLLSNTVRAVVPEGNYYLLFFAGGLEGSCNKFQKFHPQGPRFETYELMPGEVRVRSPRGQEAKMRWLTGGYASEHVAEGARIWFTAKQVGLGRGCPWGDSDFAQGLVCYDRADQSYTFFSPRSTESRPRAGDGLLFMPHCLGFDGNTVWMVESWLETRTAYIQRYDRATHEFTRYHDETGIHLPPFHSCNQIAVTKDSVWFATDRGILRYRKFPRFPKVVSSNPANGAQAARTNRAVTATFDMPMSWGTINATTVELLVNGGACAGAVSYDAKTRSVVFTPQGNLPGGMTCELVLKSHIQAWNGNPLRSTTIKFTTEP